MVSRPMSTEQSQDPAPWGTLAKQLKVSRQAVAKWKKIPGAPTAPNLSDWQAFVEEHQLGVVGNRVSKGREELLGENLTKKNRLLDLQIGREERSMVDRADVDQLLLHVGSLAKTTLYPAMERELPARAAGRSAAEIAVIGREIADRICEQMQRGFEAWGET